MAILKHIASKNADYGETQRYLIFQHDEYSGKPILNDNGKMLFREEYYLDGIHCDPFTFGMELNARFQKTRVTTRSNPITISSALIRRTGKKTD